MAASKLTIDLTDENKATLEHIKSNLHWPYGTTINNLLSTFCGLPDGVRNELLNMIKPRLKELYHQMDLAGDFEFKELSEKCQAYNDIATFLNNGKRITLESLEKEPTMKKISVKDGYLIVPSDWIDINPDQADELPYAGVIECRNSKKYSIPHFVFHSNMKYGNEYDDLYTEHIYELCVDAYPEFKKILASQVTPIADPEHPGQYLNSDEFMNAPTIGLFSIYVQGDATYGKNYDPPAGARIIRTNQTDD